MSIKIKLPELGDGIDSGDVLEVLVSEGDVIEKEQGVVELETDKATVEVPSSHAGTVTKVHMSVGETIKIGATLISVEAWQAEEAAPARPQTTAPAAKAPPADKPAESPPPTTENASARATARARLSVPERKATFSKTPMGPFQRMVFAWAISRP